MEDNDTLRELVQRYEKQIESLLYELAHIPMLKHNRDERQNKIKRIEKCIENCKKDKKY